MGAGSGVIRNVAAGVMAFGNPAKRLERFYFGREN